MATPQNQRNFESLKRQTFFLSALGNVVRLMIIALIPAAFGLVIYLCTVGPVWPWTIDPIKSWISRAPRQPKVVIKNGAPDEDEPSDPITEPLNIPRPRSSIPLADPLVAPLTTQPANPPSGPQLLPPLPPGDEPPPLPRGTVPPPVLVPPDQEERAKALYGRLNASISDLTEATKARDKVAKALKAAQTNLADAETQLSKHKATLNSNTYDYNYRSLNGPDRGRRQDLNRFQESIDRASNRIDETMDLIGKKKAILSEAKTNSDDAEKEVLQAHAKVMNLTREAEELTKLIKKQKEANDAN